MHLDTKLPEPRSRIFEYVTEYLRFIDLETGWKFGTAAAPPVGGKEGPQSQLSHCWESAPRVTLDDATVCLPHLL